VQKGTKYALVVGDKVYALETSDQAALDNLSKLAWEEAKSHGHSQRRYHFGEVGDRRQVGAGDWWGSNVRCNK